MFRDLRGGTCELAVLLFLTLPLLLLSCAADVKPEATAQSEAHNRMGYSYFNSGQLNEAYAEFQKAIILDPGNKEALNQLGYISSLYKKYDDAIAYYQRSIAADPNYSEAMNNLGVVYGELERWDEAIRYFNAALKNVLYRSPEKAYSNMGYAYYRKGEYALAEKALNDALLRNPVYPVARQTLGQVYAKQGNDHAAIEEFHRVLGIMPDNMDAHWELAQAYLRIGERDKALGHFRTVAEKDSDLKRSREALEYIELLK